MHYLHSKPVLTLLFLSILSLNCLSAQSLEDFCGTTPYPVSSTDLILKRHKDIENFTKNSRIILFKFPQYREKPGIFVPFWPWWGARRCLGCTAVLTFERHPSPRVRENALD